MNFSWNEKRNGDSTSHVRFANASSFWKETKKELQGKTDNIDGFDHDGFDKKSFDIVGFEMDFL